MDELDLVLANSLCTCVSLAVVGIISLVAFVGPLIIGRSKGER